MPKIIAHDLNNNKVEIDSEKFYHRPSVYGLLFENGKILLSKQFDGYDFPGGGVDIHETIEEALKREFWEETGLKVEPVKLLHCETSFFVMRKGDAINATLIYYLCKKIGGELSADNLTEEEGEYVGMPEWVDVQDLDKTKFYNALERNNSGSATLIKKVHLAL